MFNISKREKNILIFGITFLALFFGFQLGIVPFYENRENLTRILNEKQTAIGEMLQLQEQFNSVSNNKDISTQVLERRKKDFSLFSFLDSQAQQSGVKGNVAYMKPYSKKLENSSYTLSTVKLKLTQVYLKELIDFIFHIESSQNGVSITSLSLSKAGKDKSTLDAIIETQTLMQKDKA
ncbi:MAG: general secretion pathway protein GspM [Desulfobacteraceae bacterium]|nr:general secretion pathway protein GspM [Desulfobacteraceae bacterium]